MNERIWENLRAYNLKFFNKNFLLTCILNSDKSIMEKYVSENWILIGELNQTVCYDENIPFSHNLHLPDKF